MSGFTKKRRFWPIEEKRRIVDESRGEVVTLFRDASENEQGQTILVSGFHGITIRAHSA